jgi:hypothetical protein
VAILTTLWLFRHVFHGAPLTTDENSYVFQAYNFLAGVIARPCPPLPELFSYGMIICDERVGWLSRYPPGHSLWLVPGCLLNYPHVMVALAAGLSVWLMARLGALFDVRVAWFAPALLLLSPFFLFTHGTLLSHTSGMLAALVLLYGFVRWQLTGAQRFALVAGLGWSWLCLNRTYTAALLIPPFAVYSLITLFRSRRQPAAWLGVLGFAGAALLGPVLLLLYNGLALGDPWTMTYLYYQPAETIGFGVKDFGYARYTHTLANGLDVLGRYLRIYDQWLFGFSGSLLVALTLAGRGWRKAWSPLLLAVPVCVCGGYVAYYGSFQPALGPGYYAETLPFLVLATALGAARVFSWLRAQTRGWSWGAVLLIGGWLTGAAFFVARQSSTLDTAGLHFKKLYDLVHRLPANSVVVATETTAAPPTGRRHEPALCNPHGLESQPLMVFATRDTGAMLMPKMFPHHELFTLTATNGQAHLAPLPPAPYQAQIFPEEMNCRTGQLRSSDDHPSRLLVARQERDAPQWFAFGRKLWMPPGRFVFEFDLTVSNTTTNAPVVTVDIAKNGGRETVARYEVRATNTRPTILSATLTSFSRVEPRVYYHGVGDVVFRGVRVRELTPEPVAEAGRASPP